MIAMDGFSVDEVPDSESTDEFEAGSVAIDMFDLDADGRHETVLRRTDAGITVSTDLDGDGVIDRFTSFRSDGSYETWEIFREANGIGRAESTDSGEL